MRRHWIIVLAVVALAGVAALAFAWFAHGDLDTRLACSGGRLCTEYFSLKDGLTVRAVCPREGSEHFGLRPGCESVGNDCRCK